MTTLQKRVRELVYMNVEKNFLLFEEKSSTPWYCFKKRREIQRKINNRQKVINKLIDRYESM